MSSSMSRTQIRRGRHHRSGAGVCGGGRRGGVDCGARGGGGSSGLWRRGVFGGATVMAMYWADPYSDFRRSMEEMVMSRGGASDDWGWLEEMLGWYLKANGKKTHGLIVGAFVDLLVALTSSSSSSFAKHSDEC